MIKTWLRVKHNALTKRSTVNILLFGMWVPGSELNLMQNVAFLFIKTSDLKEKGNKSRLQIGPQYEL